jgi:AAA domain, putative AbiEii toxin, Type IV TA system
MKINSLKVANILSFGPQQDFENFKFFNLFIGKNGAGKSNTFRILSGLDIDYEMVGTETDFKLSVSTTDYSGNLFHKSIPVFVPSVIVKGYTNQQCQSSSVKGLIEINYEEKTSINQQLPTQKLIKFSDDWQKVLRYDEGDYPWLKRTVKYVKVVETDAEFFKLFHLRMGEGSNGGLPFLNFGLYYIFNLHIEFLKDGRLLQGKLSRGGSLETDTTNLSSGTLQCAKILLSFLTEKNYITLIDEIELNLEAGAIRRLFEYLIWLNTKDMDKRNSYEEDIKIKIDKIIAENRYDHEGQKFSKWAITEDQKSFNDLDQNLIHLNQNQLFIASHSSVLINQFLQLGENASIYKFDLVKMDILEDDHTTFPIRSYTIPKVGLFTKVDKIENTVFEMLDNLGCKGSDLLQANGIIWVEGPSDVIYIRKWLEMYAIENCKKVFQQGIDYEFQMFGGTLLDSLCIIKDDKSKEVEELKKLVSMFSFSRNAYVVTDSDAVVKDGIIVDKSNFKKAKGYIKTQFEKLNNPNLGMWYKEGEIAIRTIEDYIPEGLKSSTDKTKKLNAQENIKGWNGKKLSEFNHDLENEIKILYDLIQKWNNL